MDIQLTEKYKIRTDKNNWIVAIPSNPKKSKAEGIPLEWQDKWFYSSFESMAEDILEMEIRASDAKTLKELSSAIVAAKNALRKLYSPLNER